MNEINEEEINKVFNLLKKDWIKIQELNVTRSMYKPADYYVKEKIKTWCDKDFKINLNNDELNSLTEKVLSELL